jgi:uncharacterized protein (DUF1778 family)
MAHFRYAKAMLNGLTAELLSIGVVKVTAWGMDQRTKSLVKASIEAAADLMGIEASAFVVMSAYARAQELLSSRQQTLLHQGDHQALLAALDKASTPTPALLETWQLNQNQVVRS